MALLKSIEYPTGVTASYWKLTSICYDYLAKEIRASFDLYADASARQAGKLSIESKTLVYSLPDEKQFELRDVIYSLAKTTEPNESSHNVSLVNSENC